MQSTESNNKSLRFIKLKELLYEAITVIDEKFECGGDHGGYGFGTYEFDKNLGKVPMVGLTTIASKDTSISQVFVSKTVIKQTFVDKQKIAVVNLGYISSDYTSMLIAQVSGIPVEQVLSGNIEDDYWTNLTSAIG
jgi:replicative DNA helicase